MTNNTPPDKPCIICRTQGGCGVCQEQSGIDELFTEILPDEETSEQRTDWEK